MSLTRSERMFGSRMYPTSAISARILNSRSRRSTAATGWGWKAGRHGSVLLLSLSIGCFGSDHRFVRIYTALRLSELPRPHRDMKILHTIRTLDPAWGGPVEGVRNLV